MNGFCADADGGDDVETSWHVLESPVTTLRQSRGDSDFGSKYLLLWLRVFPLLLHGSNPRLTLTLDLLRPLKPRTPTNFRGIRGTHFHTKICCYPWKQTSQPDWSQLILSQTHIHTKKGNEIGVYGNLIVLPKKVWFPILISVNCPPFSYPSSPF